MGCGCRKGAAQRKVSVPTLPARRLVGNSTNRNVTPSNPPLAFAPNNTITGGAMSDERRRIEKLRRDAILKALGK